MSWVVHKLSSKHPVTIKDKHAVRVRFESRLVLQTMITSTDLGQAKRANYTPSYEGLAKCEMRTMDLRIIQWVKMQMLTWTTA